jgi:hypothetical protein
MPWTETRPMQRLDFIRACHAGTDSFSALCRLLASAVKPAINGFSVLTLLTCHLSGPVACATLPLPDGS